MIRSRGLLQRRQKILCGKRGMPMSAPGGGGGAPKPLGVIDLENSVYSWGATTKARSDLFGTDGPWTFKPSALTANGYEGVDGTFAEAAILNEGLAALVDPDGVVMVFDCTVDATQVQMELHDASGFNTDGIYFRANTNSGVSDGNGGGFAGTDNGEAGRAKVAFLVSAATQSASDNGGSIVTCTPAVARPVEPDRAAISVNAGAILHSIKFYAADTDLSAVSAP